MPPNSEAGVSTNETTNNSSSLIVNNSNNLTMSNQSNSIHPNAGVQLNNGLHQPIPHNNSHFPGSAYQAPPDLYGGAKASLPPGPYGQPPSHWQGNAYRPQMMPPNPYASNPAAFSPYQSPHSRLPSAYNQQNPYMNYPPIPPQNSQYNSQYNSSSMMPPPNNNYPKMSPQQMYPPRASTQPPLIPPTGHPSSYPQGLPHQYSHQYAQNAYNKMPYFNGFLPYPSQAPMPPYGYPTEYNPSGLPPPADSSHHLAAVQPQSSHKTEFNGNQTEINSNNNNQQDQTNENNLNSSLNKNNNNSTLTSQQSPIPNTAIIDEASQASTSSSTHTEDRTDTPKLSKQQQQHSHPTTPNLLGSPSAVSLQDELDNNLSNPSWPRTPASPAINSAEHAKNKKADSLQKLYEMSDDKERKIFLDKLVQFNNENGITLNSCPHISKSLIDLYKLYYLVKERGGFADITKKKLWKEVAILLNLPIASTTSYTLRKQYIKHMLPYECKFDRNGIDPQKLLAQLESTSKKKSGLKNSSISPQPVDNNSQSSYPQSSTPQLNSSNNKPHSPVAQTPNLQSPNFQNLPYQQQQNSTAPPYHLQQPPLQPSQQQLNDENYQRKMSGAFKSGNLPPPQQQPNKPIEYYQNYDAYNRAGNKSIPSQMQNQYPPRPVLPSNQNTYPQSTDQNYQNFNLIRGQSQLAERLLKSKPSSPQANYHQSSLNHQNYPPMTSSQQMKSPTNMSFPKRHPDFNKIEQQSFPPQQPPNNYPPQNYTLGQPSSQYIQQPKQENYSNANEFLSNSFLNNYNKQQSLHSHHRQPPPPPPPSQSTTFSEQSKPSYPIQTGPSPFYPPQSTQQTLTTSSSSLVPHHSASTVVPTATVVHHPTLAPISQVREIQFPSESIEAVKPIFVKRKRLTPKDISQIDPWKLMMSLKSGLLAETTWALDVLSILLHDDNTYMYFGLQNLPGLLELLIEHFKIYLSELFEDLFKDIELENKEENVVNNEPTFEEVFVKKVLEANEKFKKKYNSEIEPTTNGYENGIDSDKEEDDLESSSQDKFKNKKFKRMKLTKLNTLSYHLDHKQVVLNKCENYTLKNRKGLPVYFVDDDESLFINDISKKWDKLNKKSIDSDSEHWKKTFFSSTDFIQRTFQPPDNNLKFAKKLKSNKDDNYVNGNSNDLIESESELEKDKNKTNKIEEIIHKDDEESNITYPRFREKIKSKKFLEDHENEAYVRDSPPLCNLNDYRESIARKCICFSTLIRNLSFVPGNETELSKNTALLLILGRLILLHHKHLEKKSSKINLINLDDETSLFNENTELDSDTKMNLKENEDDDSEWWYDTLIFLRENALVTISNISATLNLSKYAECISLPIFKGLLHWIVCTSSVALDNFKTSSITTLSPSRLSLEALSRMSILESNVDLILSTPPHNRDITIFETLVNHLRRNEDQTIREFALVLVYNFIMADPNIARTVALTTDAIQQLIVYIETAEQNALNFINQHGIHNFKENSETLGTTVDMIKRAALCLRCLARIQENHNLFFTYQQRLVQLVMSNIFDQKITSIIADVIYEISVDDSFHFKYLNNYSNNNLKKDSKEELKNLNENDSKNEEEDNNNNNLKTDLKSLDIIDTSNK